MNDQARNLPPEQEKKSVRCFGGASPDETPYPAPAPAQTVGEEVVSAIRNGMDKASPQPAAPVDVAREEWSASTLQNGYSQIVIGAKSFLVFGSSASEIVGKHATAVRASEERAGQWETQALQWRDSRDEERAAHAKTKEEAKRNEAVCHCGQRISDHTGYDGHSFVEMNELSPYAEQVVEYRAERDAVRAELERVKGELAKLTNSSI